MFAFRPMTPADKPAMLDVSSRIWDGDDYIPLVFDAWVGDPLGEFAAVTLDGKLVGCGKLTFLTPTDAWLEGLRKDPLVKEGGLAEAVARHFLSLLAARRDLTSIRFSTSVENLASITVNERMGFRRVLALSCKSLEAGRRAGAGPGAGTRTSRPTFHGVSVLLDEQQVFRSVERSAWFEQTKGLVVQGWKALPYRRELLRRRFIESGCCRGVLRGGEVLGLAISALERGRVRLVCLEALDDEIADNLFDDIAGRFGGLRDVDLEWMIPPLAQPRRLCERWGLASWEQEGDFLVYEFPLLQLARLRAGGQEVSP